jgi:preprotein translocase SecE subunit
MKKQEKRGKGAKSADQAAKKAEIKKSAKTEARAEKVEKPARSGKPGVMGKILSPFVKFGRYVAASFRELRLMRFPNRKTAWKMTLAVVIYALIFFIFIALLDAFWSTVFQKLLG